MKKSYDIAARWERQRLAGWRNVLLAIALLHSPTGFAQIYGFVDSDHVSHFAAEPIDKRYKLLGGGMIDSGLSEPGKASARSLERLRRHPGLLKYESLLQQAGAEFKVDPALLKAVAAAESGFDPEAVSPKGAIGLMQLMPATAERFGLTQSAGLSLAQRLKNPEINVRLSARYLAELSRMFPGSPTLVIAAYNAGEGAVRRNGNAVPPYDETRGYVALVSQLHRIFGGTTPARQGALLKTSQHVGAPARIHLTIPSPTQSSAVQPAGI